MSREAHQKSEAEIVVAAWNTMGYQLFAFFQAAVEELDGFIPVLSDGEPSCLMAVPFTGGPGSVEGE